MARPTVHAADSAAERKAAALLRAAGLSGWRQHYLASGYELDLAFPEHLVGIEVNIADIRAALP